MSDQRKAEARQWLAFAKDDLAYGLEGVSRFPRAAAWNFQQAAEKALKALLISHDLPVPRSHDLGHLLTLLMDRHDPPEGVREAALELTGIGPATRYPADSELITFQSARGAGDNAAKIVSWVAGILG